MAYGKIYEIIYKNRIQRDIYRCEIWQKDYVGDSTELSGAEDPFFATYQDAELLTPIKPVELTLSFWIATGMGVEDFYSDDDEQFRIDHYFQSFEDGSGTEKLLFSGYLIQDGVSEPITDHNHTLTLKATDNIALLKNVKWNEATPEYFGSHPISFYFRNCLKQTGLYSHDTVIDMSLPLRLYGNLFETSTDDRDDDPEADPYALTIVDAGLFMNTDNTWKDCYEVLEILLTDLNACLAQADGAWNVWRPAEYKYFTDGEILGTQYVYNGSGTDIDAITLESLVNIAHTGGDCYPVAEDQTKSIQRPIKYVLNTFNYNQPGSFIRYNDLQLPSGATPYDTNTVGDLRYDDYSIATYFPEWIQRNGDASYLEVVTNTLTDTEEDRYIVTPSPDDDTKGVQFNPIPVSKGDTIDFTCQFRTFTDTDDDLYFGVRFLIITDGATSYNSLAGILWESVPSNEWDTANAVYVSVLDDAVDTSLWMTWHALQESAGPDTTPPLIPVDGILLVQVMGSNKPLGGTDNQTTLWKDMKLTINQYINQSTQITGQTHLDTGTSTIKATEESEINIDDSPRNTIAGTLFTDAISTFEHTDINTGEETSIGSIYFTKTQRWHRADIIESLRLGNIITQERLLLKYTSRLIVEGTFRNIRYDTDKFISILSFFQIAFYTGRKFLSSSLTIDYMNCAFKSRMPEIENTANIIDQPVYLFGDKTTETGITNGTIEFDIINYFGGADDFLTPSLSNSRFTYTGITTTVDLSIIFYVPISGSGTATFTILKNGSIIATETVNAAEVFKVIDFNIPGEAITNADYIEASVDTGGADVDIQMGSINITVNGVQAGVDDYLFNFLYKTD